MDRFRVARRRARTKASTSRRIAGALCVGLVAAAVPVVVPPAAAQEAPPPEPALAFAAAPEAADPGVGFEIAPLVEVTGTTDDVTLSLVVAAGQPTGTLTCDALTVTPDEGVAAFEGCAIDKGGRYLLRATAGDLSVDSESFVVSGPAYVAFSTQPSGGEAGDAWLGQPVAAVVDGDGAVVDTSTARVGLVIKPGTGTGGATLTCTDELNATAAVAGVATFEGCRIDQAGAGYELYAIDVDDSLFGTSAPFDVNAGPATALRFDVQPGGDTAAAPLGASPTVAVVDAAGNRVAASTAEVTLSVTPGTGGEGATIDCAADTVAAVDGIATFEDCAIGVAGSGYTLTASSPSLTAAVSTSFDVTAGGPSALAFTTDPGGGPGGAPFATQPVVAVTDAGGNPVDGLVQLAVKQGTGAAGAALTCDANPAVATDGVATFSGCAIDLASADPYVLVATLGTLTAESDGFDVTTGAPTSVEFTTDPGDGQGGTALGAQPTVELRDAGGNLAAGAVTIALAPGFGTPGATLSCDGGTTVNTSGGIATFSGCAVDLAGPGYRLVATVSGADASDTSGAFDVTVGDPTRLSFATSPGGGTGGTAWETQPVVAVLDAGGNVVVSADVDVDLAVTSGTGPGTLTCTVDPLAVANGRAFFTGCSIDRLGEGYTLTATASGLESATSDDFDVTVGAAAALRFSAEPSAGTAGQTLGGQPAVVVVDAGGNPVPSAGGNVTLTITRGTGAAGASLSCAATTVAVGPAGTAAFQGCAVDRAAGGYALTATWGTLTAESLPFVVLPATAPPLEVAPATAPVAQTYGRSSLAPNPTAVVDDVNTATGALHRVFSDLQVAGVGQDLVVERTYNSNDPTGGVFGPGFTSVFDLAVTFNANATVATVRGPDGQQVTFTGHQGSWTPGPGVRAELKCTGNRKTCTVSQWDGTTWTVTGTRLDSYTDATGYGLTFTHVSATRLTVKLATTDKKATYDVEVTRDSAGRITRITTPAGRTVSYGYTAGRLSAFTDARGETWAYAYDASGRLTGITDPRGATRLAVTYDASGRVATAAIRGGAVRAENRFSYDAAAGTTTREALTDVGGQLVWVPYVDTYRDNVLVRQTFPDGGTMRYSYDNRLDLVAIQDPAGFVQEWVWSAAGDLIAQRTPIDATRTAVVQFTYSNHQMVSQTDANGGRTTYVYSNGNVLMVTPPTGSRGTTRMEYDGTAVLTAIVTPIGRKAFTNDRFGNRIRTFEYGPWGPTLNGNGSRATYDEAGRMTSSTDPRGVSGTGAVDPAFTTTWTYDAAGNLVETRSPVGVVTTFTYDEASEIVSSESPAGVTTYEWDEATRTRIVTAPGGAVTRSVFDPSGNLLAETSANGGTTTYTNDALGRAVVVTDPAGRRTELTYDALSNAVRIDDGAGTVVRQQFDSVNRLIRRAAGDDQTLVAYDLAGNVVRVEESTGAVTTRTYDARNNVAAVTDPAGTTTYQYDAADNVVRRVDGRGRATTYTYDGMGRVLSESVDGNTTTYVLDVAGRRVATVDPEGRRTDLTLDGANRVTRTVHSQTGLPSITVDQTYDWQDRRTSMTSNGVTSTYTYDARGNLAGAGPDGARFTYDHSQPGRIVETYPDGTTVTYEVDDAGALMRLDGHSADGDVQASYLRDAERRPTAIALSNGVLQTRGYDAAGNVVAQSVRHGATVLAGETYTYDAAGNRLSQRTTAAGRSVLNAYAYDALGRVVGFSSTTTDVPEPTVPDPTGATPAPPSELGTLPVPASLAVATPQPEGTPTDAATTPATNIAYDAVGNITTLTGTGYAHGGADQITSQTNPGAQWTHDRSGAVTGMRTTNGTATFTYDAAGRLARATVQPTSGPAVTVTYTYDGDGNRTSRTVGGVTTEYVWDPGAPVPLLVLERAGGTVQRRYFNGEGGPVAVQTPGETYYVHSDPLGSTNQLTDSSGAVVAAYHYDAFGMVTATGPAAAATDILFQGQQLDPVTGLYNMRARNYDPGSGRFTQREPVATPTGIPLVSAYAFVGNRPTVFTDPTGETPSLESVRALTSIFPSPSTTNAKIVNYSKLGTTGLKLGLNGGAALIRYAAMGSHGRFGNMTAPYVKGLGTALSVAGIGLQAYVTAENCQHGPPQQCVGSAVGLALNIAFTVGCSFVTSGAGSTLCSLGGMMLGFSLEFAITKYGPEMVDALVTFGELTEGALTTAGTAIANGVLTAADEIANAGLVAGGAIVSGFNQAGAAIASGYQDVVDTLNQVGPAAAQLGTVLADTFGFAYDQTAAALIGLGYDIQGIAEMLGERFVLTAEEAAAVLRDTFSAGAAEVAAALVSAYDATVEQAAAALRAAGYAVNEVAGAIDAAYDVTVAELAQVLTDIEYGFDQVVGALGAALDVTAEAMAEALRTLDATVQQIAGLLQDFYELGPVAAAVVLDGVGFAVGEVAAGLQDAYHQTAALAAKVLQEAGYLAGEIATGLHDAYAATAAQVAQMLKDVQYAAGEVAAALASVYEETAAGVTALLKGAGYVAGEVAVALSDVFQQTVADIAGLLHDAGYALQDITRVLNDVFARGLADIAVILGQIGYGVEYVAAALRSVLGVAANQIVAVLGQIGATVEQIGVVLRSVYHLAATQAAALLASAGYAFEQIGAVLDDVFHLAATGAASILKALGATAVQIKDVLEDAYHQSVDAIGNVLSSIGFTSDVISSIGGAFEDFGNSVAGFFSSLF